MAAHFPNEETTAMMTALILICSLVKTPLAMNCGIENAVDVLKVPGEYHSLVACFSRAQSFLAESRYELAGSHYSKFVCGRSRPPANVGLSADDAARARKVQTTDVALMF
jgi:hypothetical protein